MGVDRLVCQVAKVRAGWLAGWLSDGQVRSAEVMCVVDSCLGFGLSLHPCWASCPIRPRVLSEPMDV